MTPPFVQPAATRPGMTEAAARRAARITADLKITAGMAPRSLQHAVGPSELGTPCLRRLGYRLLDWEPKANQAADPWPAMIGTAVHAYMAEVYGQVNERAGRDRYLIEHPVQLPYGVAGTLDLYDGDTGTVLDWKVPGPSRLKEYRAGGPGEQYRIQVHLYGLGMLLQGRPVREVAIVFLPRTGLIDGMHVWSEPFDHSVAVAALERYQSVWDFHQHLDPETYPDRWALLPTADAYCTWCPFYLPGSSTLRLGCPGHKPSSPPKNDNRKENK